MTSMEQIVKVLPSIIEQIKKDGKMSGIIKCPICEDEMTYHVSSYNGHRSVQCRTPGCVAFME